MKTHKPFGMQLDRYQKPTKSRQHYKKYKCRAERRRAKADPEAAPFYNRYSGWI